MKTAVTPIDTSPPETEAQNEKKVLDEALKRFKRCYEYEERNRSLAEEDVEFRHGDQWPEGIRAERQSDDRPVMTFNKMEERIDQVTGDQRQAKAAITIFPAEGSLEDPDGKNKAGTKDYKVSQIMNGLIRSIEQNSDAQIAYTTGSDHAAGHGFGYWRVITEYDPADPFRQVIRIRRVKNSFSVYLDPDTTEPHGGDSNWGFVSSMVSKATFEAKWPGKATTGWDFAGQGDEYKYWFQDEEYRVVEYFRKVPIKKIAARMQSGAIYYVDPVKGDDAKHTQALAVLKSKEDRVLESKETTVPKVEWFLMSAVEFLEEPREFPSFYIPIIRVIGKELNVKGYDYFRGVIRHAKDAQRMYNFNRTAQIEQTALQPKVPFILTPEQMGAFKTLWESANKENNPYLLYEYQEGVPPPQRSLPPVPSQAHILNAASDDADMDSTTGMHKASRGEQSNEKSGKAIRERKLEGDVANFAYHDNKHLALKQTGRILVDMIPRIYDKRTVVRILTPEDEDDFVELNQTILGPDGKSKKINDLGVGRYDVRISAGPSYTTMREEARESMTAFAQAMPEVAPLIADLIAENQDWPKADAIAERLRKQLPPGIVDDDEGKEEITPQMVEQAVMEATAEVQEQIDNKVKLMDAETKRMTAENKGSTDEFKALTERIEAMQAMMVDEEKIMDIVAKGIAELLQQEGQ